MKNKKIFTVFICFVLCLCLSACKKSNDTDSNKDNSGLKGRVSESISLLYCASDTYDPYTLISKANEELCKLLYDPLYKTDNNFEPIEVLAQTAYMDSNVWTVVLKDVKFTDGTTLTGEDIVFSYELAKNCPRYSSQLSEISSVSVSGKNVVFTLSANDPYFLNVLNFPIIKSGSNSLYDKDSVLMPPIGTGRYILNEEKTLLIRNDAYFGNKGSVATVNLRNAPDSESVSHYVEVGASDIYYADTSEGSIIRMSGKKATVNRNVLIYIGINDNDELLKNINMRYAVSSALDREKIVGTTFFGNAVAATGPFHPSWKEAATVQPSSLEQNIEISIENLEEIGYNKLNTNGYRTNLYGTAAELSLLVNSENTQKVAAAEMIRDQLKDAGIKVNIEQLSYADYIASLENGEFQLYLGEVKLDNNFDISQLVVSGGSCAYGKVENSEENFADVQNVVANYRSGTASVTNVITAIQSQMPFIPVCYRNGIVFYNEDIDDGLTFSEDDIFLSVDRLILRKN